MGRRRHTRPTRAVRIGNTERLKVNYPDTALSLSEALGTSAELWLNLQTAYLLHSQI